MLINERTALGTGPISPHYLSEHLLRHGVYLDRIRADRVLHEALTVGPDPLHLALVFNLSHTTASRYATIAQNLLDDDHPPNGDWAGTVGENHRAGTSLALQNVSVAVGVPGRRWRLIVIGATLGMMGLAALAGLIIFLPSVVVDYDLAGAHVNPQDRLDAVSKVRTTFLQAVGGVVVFFGAYATWRQLQIGRDGLAATREAHVTDRFSRAVDQLGSDKLDVRIGGIHTLWRIGDHSTRDREAIISIMAAYVRTHLPWPPPAGALPAADTHINAVPPLETRAADTQIALTAMGVLCQERQPEWLNLSSTDLRRADCDGLWLQGIIFDRSCMEAASVFQVNLTRASLAGVNLRHAALGTSILRQTRCVGADLRGARLVETDLSHADFSDADLREANLRKARVSSTCFLRADLRLADLRGIDLSDADLREAKLNGALVSASTTWPAGFDTGLAGVTLTDDLPVEPAVLSGATLRLDVAPLRSAP
ncbi:hypothetical protein FAIPA1_50141 [Frankia sp. AiPs1]|uniref:pentapeptide repeat-containing protein n=1 Tax=Frankia sp. AiPa1 TaxID=573492 RepID=UPI00202B3149|nr:pentapeptide repeat-containing protein [Frankia sp. AiPa1]MCL9758879.1 pentapeptide repeat-containing protein [Frankia sp. AiPa1]